MSCNAPKPKSRFNYKQQYGLIVICHSEKEQQELYKKLTGLGLKVRVVVV